MEMNIGEKIRAVQKVRAETGCYLKQAKDDVEEYAAAFPLATWEQAADAIISSHKRLLEVDAECARIREERAEQAQRVTAGYTIEELRAMPYGALSAAQHEIGRLKTIYDELLAVAHEANLDRLRLAKERDMWERRARDLESLCADRL